jgi:copper chaperone CopZ
VDTNWLLHTAVVTYDDEVTNLEALKKALADEGFYVEGEPVFVK